MKEGKEWLDELDASLGETPDMFHRRVEQTLRILQTERTEACTTKRKVNGAIILLAAMLLLSAVAVAAKFTGVLDFITPVSSACGAGHSGISSTGIMRFKRLPILWHSLIRMRNSHVLKKRGLTSFLCFHARVSAS